MPGPIFAETTAQSSVAGTGITAIRRELAPMVGPFALIQTTSDGAGPDSLRSVISSRLRDPSGQRGKLDGRYAYIPGGDNAGFCSPTFPGGLDTGTGELLLSIPFAANLPAGTAVELSSPLPAVSDGDMPSLNDAIRAALWTLPIYQDYPLTYAERQVRYYLTGLPFVPRLDELEAVLAPLPSGQTAAQSEAHALNRGAWDFQYDADGPYLLLRQGFTDGDTFTVRWRRWAATWVRSGGVWGSSDDGPSDEQAGADPDAVLYDAPTVARTALPIALERLVEYARDRDDAKGVQKYERRLENTRFAALLGRQFGAFRTSGAQRANGIGAR